MLLSCLCNWFICCDGVGGGVLGVVFWWVRVVVLLKVSRRISRRWVR